MKTKNAERTIALIILSMMLILLFSPFFPFSLKAHATPEPILPDYKPPITDPVLPDYKPPTTDPVLPDYKAPKHDISVSPFTMEEQKKDENFAGGFWDWQWDVAKYISKDFMVELAKWVGNNYTIDVPNMQNRLIHDARIKARDQAKIAFEQRIQALIDKYRGQRVPEVELKKNWQQYVDDYKRLTDQYYLEKYYDEVTPKGLTYTGVKIARGGVNLFLPDDPDKKPSSYLKLGVDVWSGVDNYQDYKSSMEIYRAYQESQKVSTKGYSIWKNGAAWYKKTQGIIQIDGVATKVVSKANVFTGLAGSVISGYDAYRAFEKGDYDEAIAGVGDGIIGLAPAATMAFGPVGGTACLAIGGLLWAGGTLSKYWRKGYFKPENIKNAAKQAWNKTKSIAKGAVNKIKGWFS